MENFTPDTIILFLYFFVPGYISMNVYRMFVALDKIDYSKSFYEAIGISCIFFVLLFWPIHYINQDSFRNENPISFYLLTILIIFILPIFLTWVFHLILKSKRFERNFISQEKTTWDSFFSQKKSYWVIVTMKDGKKVGGKFGSKSMASVFPAPREIYIEDAWKLDNSGKLIKSQDRNRGLILLGENILTIEFFN